MAVFIAKVHFVFSSFGTTSNITTSNITIIIKDVNGAEKCKKKKVYWKSIFARSTIKSLSLEAFKVISHMGATVSSVENQNPLH